MARVRGEYRSQVRLVVDQHPIGALSPYGAYPPLGVAVRPWRLWRSLRDRDALVGENLIEGAGELGVTVPD